MGSEQIEQKIDELMVVMSEGTQQLVDHIKQWSSATRDLIANWNHLAGVVTELSRSHREVLDQQRRMIKVLERLTEHTLSRSAGWPAGSPAGGAIPFQ